MDLADALAATPGPGDEPRPDRKAPAGWQSGYEWDGRRGQITTRPMEAPPDTWDEYIRDCNLDPAEVMVVGTPQFRGWDANVGRGEIKRLHYYRINIVRRTDRDIESMIALVKRDRAPRRPRPDGTAAFVVALGDLQLGKIDGDGIEGTILRTLAGLDAAVQRLMWLRRYLPCGHIHIAWLGDCIEGFNSQGGANAWRTQTMLTEQTRIVRRLMLHAVQLFAPLAPKVTVVSVPGNHDEPQRFSGKGITRFDDSHAVDALVAVGDALAMNPKAYSHVQLLTPAPDELTVTADIAGTIIAHAHGHQWNRGKHFDWLAGQALGDQHPGAADLLLAGHLHHLQVDSFGRKTFMQIPALESESTYYRHRTGASGNPGILTFLTADKRWSDLAVL